MKRTSNNRIVVSAGEVLKDFIAECGITYTHVARSIGISPTAMSNIIKGKDRITPNVASKLAKYFDQSISFWLDIQNHCDLVKAEAEFDDKTSKIIPFSQEMRLSAQA